MDQLDFIHTTERQLPHVDWTNGCLRFRETRYHDYLLRYPTAYDVWRALANTYVQDGCFYNAWVIGKHFGFGTINDISRIDQQSVMQRCSPVLSEPITAPPEFCFRPVVRIPNWASRELLLQDIIHDNSSHERWSELCELYLFDAEPLMAIWSLLVIIINSKAAASFLDQIWHPKMHLILQYRTRGSLMCSLIPELSVPNMELISSYNRRDRFEYVQTLLPSKFKLPVHIITTL